MNPAIISLAPAAYTINQFCMRYQIGRTSVYTLIEAGKLQARKAGRKTLIDAESAARWYASLPTGVAA